MTLSTADLTPHRPVDGTCIECSCNIQYRCRRCAAGLCTRHSVSHTCTEADATKWKARQMFVIATRGDFSIVKEVHLHETRYHIKSPVEAESTGVTLSNLHALWHLIGEAIEGEEPRK